jgi:hypothetical protein
VLTTAFWYGKSDNGGSIGGLKRWLNAVVSAIPDSARLTIGLPSTVRSTIAFPLSLVVSSAGVRTIRGSNDPGLQVELIISSNTCLNIEIRTSV